MKAQNTPFEILEQLVKKHNFTAPITLKSRRAELSLSKQKSDQKSFWDVRVRQEEVSLESPFLQIQKGLWRFQKAKITMKHAQKEMVWFASVLWLDPQSKKLVCEEICQLSFEDLEISASRIEIDWKNETHVVFSQVEGKGQL